MNCARATGIVVLTFCAAVLMQGCGGGTSDAPTSPHHVVPTGPRLAYLYQSRVHVIDPNGSNDSTVTPATRDVWWYAWHGATERIAYLDNGALRILDRATGSDRIVSSVGSVSDVKWIDWSPDGSRLLYSEGAKLVVVTESGGSPITLSVKTDMYSTPMWSPDGQSVVTADEGSKAIWIVPANGGAGRKLDGPAGVAHARWAPNGQSVVFEGKGGIWIAPADGSPAHEILHASCSPYCGSNDVYQYPRFAPDGSKLAGIMGPGAMWIANPDGSSLVRFPAQTPIAPLPEWSADGSLIAFIGGSLSRMDVYTMHPDGSFMGPVTNLGRVDLPRWVR